MVVDHQVLRKLMCAIVDGDQAAALAMLTADPSLAKAKVAMGATRMASEANFFPAILHYVYAGDTVLHIAAAAYRTEIARRLIALGAHVSAKNRRKAEPLHYAVDGGPGAPHWNPEAQARMVTLLIEAGADPNAVDQGGVTPLHRAVRNRCSSAVEALLRCGADPTRKNASGSTPMLLATVTSGRGGTGEPDAKAEQAAIIALLERA